MFRESYDNSALAVLNSVFMVLTILIGWLALAALATLFVYCCSCVSNGKRSELTDDDFAAESPAPLDTGARVGAAWAVPTAYERRRTPRPVAAQALVGNRRP